MTTPIVTIDDTGIHAPTLSEAKAWLESQFRNIFGADLYLEPDSQDGQLIGILAQAITDANNAAVTNFLSQSPLTATGAALSRLVKINGLQRRTATASTVDLRLIGQAGTLILDGIVKDDAGFEWNLPASVVIPESGEITVTATCAVLGAVMAPPNTVRSIETPFAGWQEATNLSAAAPGSPVETDQQLRVRQAVASGLPSVSALGGIVGALSAVAGVTRGRVYENTQGFPDENGIPGHSVCFVIEGGDVDEIAAAMLLKKTPGTGLYGDTVVSVTDEWGIPRKVAFFRPAAVPVGYEIEVRALDGFTFQVMDQIAAAMVAWTQTLGIGDDVLPGRAYVPANSVNASYQVLSVKAARNGGEPVGDTVPIRFNEYATCEAINVKVLVVR